MFNLSTRPNLQSVPSPLEMSAEKDNSFRVTLLHFEKIWIFLIPCTNETFTIMCNTHRITKSLQHTEDLRWALKRSGDLLLMSFTATPVSLHWQRQIYGWEQQTAQPSVMHTLTDPLNVIYSLCYSRQNIRISKMQTQTTAEERVWELHKVVMVIVMLLRPLNKTKSSSYRKPDYYQKLSFWLEA